MFQGDYFTIMCEIQKFETVHGWEYDGCGKCASKIKGDVADFICPVCKKEPEVVEPKSVVFYSSHFHNCVTYC